VSARFSGRSSSIGRGQVPAQLRAPLEAGDYAAKITDFRFHDLRHTFASRLAMGPVVDLYTIQRAGGWKTPIMVQRYAHLSPDHMRAAVEKLAQAAPTISTGTKTGTRTT
jgi:integrase